MAEEKKEYEVEYEFPDEKEGKEEAAPQEAKGKPVDETEIEVIDDTPEEDRGRQPLPQEIVQELEADELEEYSDKVKTRLKQMKKVWHDERREKERALREHQEALAMAQKLLEENKKLKGTVNERETALVSSFKETAARNLEIAKREYREAHEEGDSDKIVEAQAKLTAAQIRAEQAERFKPTPLQVEETPVNIQQQTQVPRPDQKAAAWQERNQWFGQDRVMTALALGLHEDLVAVHGPAYATTDEYYQRIDTTIRAKFPEKFGGEVKTTDGGGKPVQRTETKAATVVAPASRSTAPKKVRLTQSQMNTIKRLQITPEQYVKEFMKLENQNG
jgi:hypothetical protein